MVAYRLLIILQQLVVMYKQAALYFREDGKADKGAEVLVKAAKLLGDDDREGTMELFKYVEYFKVLLPLNFSLAEMPSRFCPMKTKNSKLVVHSNKLYRLLYNTKRQKMLLKF